MRHHERGFETPDGKRVLGKCLLTISKLSKWPRGLLISLATFSLIFAFTLFVWTFGHSRREHKFARNKDQGEYVSLARDFSHGNFTNKKTFRPWRHPLYPALLAPLLYVAPDNRHLLGAVNGVVGFLTVMLSYYFVFKTYRRHDFAFVISFLLATDFFFAKVTGMGIVTEPTYIFLALCSIWIFSIYLEKHNLKQLVVAVFFMGLAYLTRPNGLFLPLSAIFVLLLQAFFQAPKRFKVIVDLLVVAGVFLLVASPLLIIKYKLFGNPFHQGYIVNFLWMDDYETALHAKNPSSASEYLRHYGAGHILFRISKGFYETLLTVPVTEAKIPFLYLLTLIGIFTAAVSSWKSQIPNVCFLMAVMCLVQMSPLAWTKMSNPTNRIPYAALLPFLLYFGAYGLQRLSLRMSIQNK